MVPAQALRLMLQWLIHGVQTYTSAARRREKRKEDKYQHKRLPAGDVVSFVPLVFEHFGRWGEKAEGFLKELIR